MALSATAYTLEPNKETSLIDYFETLKHHTYLYVEQQMLKYRSKKEVDSVKIAHAHTILRVLVTDTTQIPTLEWRTRQWKSKPFQQGVWSYPNSYF